MELRLEDLTERESVEFEGFNERLVRLLPGLSKHHCSRGHEGGFLERLDEGTYFGHVVEHVALELAGSIGRQFTYGKTIYGGERGLYHVIVRYESERVMRHLLSVAVELVESVLAGDEYPLAERLEEARRLDAEGALGPSTKAIVEAAGRRGIPWRRLDDASLIQFGYGRNRRLIRAALSDGASYIAVETASDKALTKQLLRAAFIPVPHGIVTDEPEAALRFVREVRGPVVVKPLDGNQGNGVAMNVDTPDAVRKAFECARQYSRKVIVEEQIFGRDYRLLVVGGRLVAAAERVPCRVVGDGRSTVRELIDALNADPRRGDGHERPLTRVPLDEELAAYLHRQGYGLDYVPGRGESVRLRDSANLSQGGEAVDVTDAVHPQIRQVAERAARVVGLDICGVDLVTEDVSLPLTGAIVELNAAPGLRMHLYPSAGESRPVGEAIVDMLYPEGAESRIPIAAITGTNGKTTVARLIGHVLGATGITVGVTTTDGVYIGGQQVASGDMTGPGSARVVLSDPAVEAAVLETARGGILRRGLGYDWADVAVVTNIRLDHIGQDGIDEVEDLVWIKSLVAERVREGGTLVLNGEDAEASRLIERPGIRGRRINVVMYGVDSSAPTLARHLAAGGTVVTVRKGWLCEERASGSLRLLPLDGIPLAQAGAAVHQVSNLLAAVATCRALNVSVGPMLAALQDFSSVRHNPGRGNLFRYGSGFILVDYGHNPDAFAATSAAVGRWAGQAIGIVGMPGDRSDRVIGEAAQVLASGFARLVIREDRDLRGRKPGELADLLWREVRKANPELPCSVVLDEREAIRSVLPDVAAGATAVLFYEDLGQILTQLRVLGATPVDEADLLKMIPGPGDGTGASMAAPPG